MARLRSEGLLDKPEEATYYDYLLTDPKDAPYASFQFHYRSWKNLTQLHLIPTDDCQISPSTSSSTIRPANLENSTGRLRKQTSEQFSFEFPSHPGVDSEEYGEVCGIENEEAAQLAERVKHPLKATPALAPAPRKSEQAPQPSKAIRDGFLGSYLRRALPDLPQHAAADESKTHSRQSSSTSKGSITPSLYPYVDDESFLTEAIEIGIARSVEVVLHHDPKKGTFIPRGTSSDDGRHVPQPQGCDGSASDYNSSIVSSNESKTSLLLSPGNYFATNGSDLYSSPLPGAGDSPDVARSPEPHQPVCLGLNGIDATRTFTPPTEGEWMNRAWDPIKRTPRTAAGLASPQLSRPGRIQVPNYRPSSENALYGERHPSNGWTGSGTLSPLLVRGVQSPSHRQRRWNEYPEGNEQGGNWI